MTAQNSDETKEKLIKLKEQISILEWDDQRMQINPYKKAQLEEMRKERDELSKDLNPTTE